MHFRLLAIAVLLGWSQAVFSAEDGGREHLIPLFMASDDELSRQGFMRVINHSNRSGTVEIHGYDDGGMEYGPIELSLDARQTLHFNSDHLEGVASRDGLDGGLGNGMGHWRLVLTSTLDIEPLAYFRNKDTGFLASMHDVVSQGAMRHHVRFFNPASNPNQLSWLRVINLGGVEANIMINGVDDNGEAGTGSVSATVPANGAYARTAVDLEADGLGDGHAKWSLTVSSDQPVQVMSLMDVPGGYLSNLSSGRKDYRGAAALWQVSFPDEMDEVDPVTGGFIILLPDSRLYAWLPEIDGTNYIARATYSSNSGEIEASGVIYQSGQFPVNTSTLSLEGEPSDVTFEASYRSGDWITGTYTVAGEMPRKFRGWAFAGFERGEATEGLAGVWTPIEGLSDLPGEFSAEPSGVVDALVPFETEDFGEIACELNGKLAAINPAYAVYDVSRIQDEDGNDLSVIDCILLAFGGPDESPVEMILAVMDGQGMAGAGNRAVVLLILPDPEQVAIGGVLGLTP